MTKTANLSVRMTLDEQRKVQQLAERAQTTPSEIMRALVRAAGEVQPLKVTIEPGQLGADCVATLP